MKIVEDWVEAVHGPIPVRLSGVPIEKHLRFSEDGAVWYGVKTTLGDERVVVKVQLNAVDILEKQAAGQRVMDMKTKRAAAKVEAEAAKNDLVSHPFFSDKAAFESLPQDEREKVQADLIRTLMKKVFGNS